MQMMHDYSYQTKKYNNNNNFSNNLDILNRSEYE
jgi:hypothetical protein